jgi:hypothetical protein
LLLFETSASETQDKPISLDSFVDSLAATDVSESEKTPIFYLCAANRQSAVASPYIEPLTSSNTPCLLVYDPLDEVVFSHLGEFKGRRILSVEQSGNVDILMERKKKAEESKQDGKEDASKEEKMAEVDRKEFMDFVKESCGQVIGTVKVFYCPNFKGHILLSSAFFSLCVLINYNFSTDAGFEEIIPISRPHCRSPARFCSPHDEARVIRGSRVAR